MTGLCGCSRSGGCGWPTAVFARKHDDPRELQGRALFAKGSYDRALEIYASLFAEKSDPIFLRNIGRCYQQLEQPEKSIKAFREYLRRSHLRPRNGPRSRGSSARWRTWRSNGRRGPSATNHHRPVLPSRLRPAMVTAPPPAIAEPTPAPAAVTPGRGADPNRASSTEPSASEPSIARRWWFWTGSAFSSRAARRRLTWSARPPGASGRTACLWGHSVSEDDDESRLVEIRLASLAFRLDGPAGRRRPRHGLQKRTPIRRWSFSTVKVDAGTVKDVRHARVLGGRHNGASRPSQTRTTTTECSRSATTCRRQWKRDHPRSTPSTPEAACSAKARCQSGRGSRQRTTRRTCTCSRC